MAITTQKVIGIAKRNDIKLVDKTRRYYSDIAYGVFIRKVLRSEICVTVYGGNDKVSINKTKEKFLQAIAAAGLIAVQESDSDSFTICEAK